MNIWGSPAERYETEKPKRKLLALNGGGIRWVKTLEILSSLEERLKKNSANASAKRDKIRRDIFICYRREDSAEVVDRIYGELQAAYPGRVFRDISEMQGGLDFEDQVKHQLQQCQAALVVIGPDWLNSRDPDGNLRLHNEGDYVRIEIESVLAREALRVFPLLVKGATLPIPDAVPLNLRPLLRRHGYPIRRDPDFKPDIARLTVALDVTLV